MNFKNEIPLKHVLGLGMGSGTGHEQTKLNRVC